MSASSWDLPGILGEIAEVAGLEAALAIADARGGSRVDIPAHPRPGHWLVELVGAEAAERICAHCRIIDADGRVKGMRVVMPRGPAGVMRRAQERLARELAAGVSPRTAARRAGLTERTAWRMRAKMTKPSDSGQGELF